MLKYPQSVHSGRRHRVQNNSVDVTTMAAKPSRILIKNLSRAPVIINKNARSPLSKLSSPKKSPIRSAREEWEDFSRWEMELTEL